MQPPSPKVECASGGSFSRGGAKKSPRFSAATPAAGSRTSRADGTPGSRGERSKGRLKEASSLRDIAAGKSTPTMPSRARGAAGRAEEKAEKGKKHGMFKGVLVPTCENMWGVIIFLRFYLIVGNAGLGNTILIVTLSFVSALLTALSLSAVATCGTSGGLTGVYPMLARALGKEVATATGIVYFLGIIFLAVLECLGACEELEMVAPSLFTMGGAVQMCAQPYSRVPTAPTPTFLPRRAAGGRSSWARSCCW
jgi:hypothetical protein